MRYLQLAQGLLTMTTGSPGTPAQQHYMMCRLEAACAIFGKIRSKWPKEMRQLREGNLTVSHPLWQGLIAECDLLSLLACFHGVGSQPSAALSFC